jgi:hypothetical protein
VKRRMLENPVDVLCLVRRIYAGEQQNSVDV